MTALATFLTAWISPWIVAHPTAVGVILMLCAVIIALDHVLASSTTFLSNSTFQAVAGYIADGASWVEAILTQDTPPPAASPSPPVTGTGTGTGTVSPAAPTVTAAPPTASTGS